MESEKSGSYVLQIKKIDEPVDLETFTIYLARRKITFAKIDFTSGDDNNDGDDNTHTATLFFSSKSEAVTAHDLLTENCAIGVKGAEAVVLLNSIDQPYLIDSNNRKTDEQSRASAYESHVGASNDVRPKVSQKHAQQFNPYAHAENQSKEDKSCAHIYDNNDAYAIDEENLASRKGTGKYNARHIRGRGNYHSRGRGNYRNSKQPQAKKKLSSLETDTTDDKMSRMFGNVDVQETGGSLCDAAAAADDTDSVYSNRSSASTQRIHKHKTRLQKVSALFVTGLGPLTTKASLEGFLREKNVKFSSITFENKFRGLTATIKFRNSRETTEGKNGIHDAIMESEDGTSNRLKASYYRDPTKSYHPSSDDRSHFHRSHNNISSFETETTDDTMSRKFSNVDANELHRDLDDTGKILCDAADYDDTDSVYSNRSSASTQKIHKHTPRLQKVSALFVTGLDPLTTKASLEGFLREKNVKFSSITFENKFRGLTATIKFRNSQETTEGKNGIHDAIMESEDGTSNRLKASYYRDPTKSYHPSSDDRSHFYRSHNNPSSLETDTTDDTMSRKFSNVDANELHRDLDDTGEIICDATDDTDSVYSNRSSASTQRVHKHVPRLQKVSALFVTGLGPLTTEASLEGFLREKNVKFTSITLENKPRGLTATIKFRNSRETTEGKNGIHDAIMESEDGTSNRLKASYYRKDPTKSYHPSGTITKTMDKKWNGKRKQSSDHKPKGNANDVLVDNIPRCVSEAELATLIYERKCKGFVNVSIYEDDTVTSKRSAKITFDSKVTAVEAIAGLYGQRLKGFCLEVKLAQEEQSGLSKLVAKRIVDELLGEIEQERKTVASELDAGMAELAKQVYELGSQIDDCNSIAMAVSLEAQKTAIEQQIGEIRGYQKEFDRVSQMTKTKLDELQPQTSEHTDLTRLDDIRQRFLRECRRIRNPLPIYGHKASILETITASDVSACVIRAETGSGKSTQVPQYLIEDEEFLAHTGSDGSFRKVICTQPRRVAAISLARRVAEEYGCGVGEEVGYIAGQTRKESSRTRVTFMTDRALLNICLADKTDLKNYACVIIDEAHERSVDTDILLAMLKQMQTRRADLKIVIMSATIDVDLFSNYLNKCPIADVPGRTYPVDVIYCGSGNANNPTEYINKAVRKAVEIHRQEDIDGDILVFLTSQNEIERACSQISSALKIPNWQDTKQGNVIILPLHGKLQPEEQMKVFKATPEGKRKIVFATNVAETSVTIPGITYVIDAGVVKECQYDPQRNMSLLKVTNITQASAEQRKGRAGRTGPGKCYRLFTKTDFDEMAQSMKPEIFRVHLGMAMLQLIKMGIQDVETFDFVESPEKSAIHKAISSLILLGAVDDNRKLTSIGMKMADLSLEPRLAKLVLTGIENDVGEDAITLASLVSAPGNIIFRGSSEDDQQNSEMQKLEFSSEGGDILTMLKIYRKWIRIPEKQRNAWCKRNSMNAKTLRAVKENAYEIKQNLKKSLEISIEKNNHNEGDENECDRQDLMLRKMLLSVYFENLSIYNGHAKAGYTIVAQCKTAEIHPSSVLKSMDSLPKWLIYGDLRRTSQDFVCNLTPVESEWIDEVVPKLFRDTIDKDALERNAIRELKIENVGTALMKTLAMKRFERLRALEDDITKQTSSPCIIEANWAAGCLNVYVADQGEDYTKRRIKEYLEDEKTRAKREQVEVSVGSLGNVRHVIVSGGETGFVLMGNEYRSLDISNVPREVTAEEIIQLCGCQPDQIKQVFKFPSHYSQAKRGVWGKVTFLNPTDAAEVTKRLEETLYPGETEKIVAQPSLPRQNAVSTKKRSAIETAVEVTWFLTRSRGFGFVTCDTTADSISLIGNVKGLPLKGKSIRCDLKKDDSRVVFITNIDYNVTPEELECALKKATSVAFNSAKIIRAKPTGEIKNTTTKKRLQQLFDIDGLKTIDINILDPKFEKSQKRKAFVNFDPSFQQEMNEKVKDLQTSPSLTDNQEMLHVRMLVTSELYCKERVYELLKDELEKFIDTVEGTGEGIVVKTMTTKNRQERRVQVTGSDYQKVFDVRMALKVLLHGEEVSVEDFVEEQKSSQWVQRALCGLSQGRLNEFHNGDDSKAFIDVDTRRCVIHIHGKEDNREEYKTSLRRYFKSLTDTEPIEMRNINLRALVKEFGPWLEQLKEDPGVEDVSIDAKKRVLMLTVSEAAKTKTLDKINDCLQNVNSAAGGSEDIECGICFCPAEADEKTYRLLSCGHYFCVSCLQDYLRHQESDKQFPIMCPCEECAEPLTLVDIRIICPQEDKQNKLFRAAFEAFVSQNKQDGLRFCPSPDCCMIYRQSKRVEPWTCTECGKQICSGCGEDVHPGDPAGNMTCAEYKKDKESSDAFLMWARAQGDNVKQCPSQDCGFIEKNGGCRHVMCIKCKKHICWECMNSFMTSGDCYAHLSAVHGGCFDY